MVGVKVGLSVCHWFRLTHDSWNKSSYYTRETNPLSTNLYLAKRRCPLDDGRTIVPSTMVACNLFY